MVLKNLTEAYIQQNERSFNISIDLDKLVQDSIHPYLLIIKSLTEKYIRITVYPVEKKNLVKLLIFSKQKDEKQFPKILELLKNYEIIHTSGLIILENQIYYECYLNMDWETKKYKELKTSLKQMKKILKLKFEKIKLKKRLN